MSVDGLRENLKHMKEIIREIYVFTNQLDVLKNLEIGSSAVIDSKEKRLLIDVINSLTAQLKIINNSLPGLMQNIGYYQKLPSADSATSKEVQPQAIQPKIAPQKLVQVKYKPPKKEQSVSVIITDEDQKEFLGNLSKSNLSISKLKKKYAVEKPELEFGKPSAYAKMSNHFFKRLSNSLVVKGYFKQLNNDLRRMNNPFVVGTYVSMIFFSILISFVVSMFVFVLLLFFDVSILLPFLILTEEFILFRALKFSWVLIAIPLVIGILMYWYPSSEAKNIGRKINQELPFVAIHMAAVATSGVEPISIFKILLKSSEYKYTNIELRKLMNLVNFHGKDIVTALKRIAKFNPSLKLKELLNGLAISMTSGGSMQQFLNKHAETLLFDYKLEREKYTRTSETFMDIYISIVIAAPMILLMLFVIMGSTGALGGFLGLGVRALSILVILGIVGLNIAFLVFLQIKQPVL